MVKHIYNNYINIVIENCFVAILQLQLHELLLCELFTVFFRRVKSTPDPDTSEKYRDTPPISMAYFCKSMPPLLAESSIYTTNLYHDTAPICITILYAWHSPERNCGDKFFWPGEIPGEELGEKLGEVLDELFWAFSCLIHCTARPTKISPQIPPNLSLHVLSRLLWLKSQNFISASFWGLRCPRYFCKGIRVRGRWNTPNFCLLSVHVWCCAGRPPLSWRPSPLDQAMRQKKSQTKMCLSTWSVLSLAELKVTELRWQRAPRTQIFAENRRFSQIRPFSWKLQHVEGAGNRRFSQKTAGNRRLGSVTLGPSPLARPYCRPCIITRSRGNCGFRGFDSKHRRRPDYSSNLCPPKIWSIWLF